VDLENELEAADMQYGLYGRSPAQILEPQSVDELAALLAEATATGQAMVPWGYGSRQHLGKVPERYDAALLTRQLDQVVDYNPADLVITVQAGARLAAVQQLLREHNQWLPWDPPCADRSSIGGALASNAFGPLRLGYGTARDWLLGMRVALGDGRLVKSGARVVKNVAGYDSHKLHLGAFGTLGVIAEATFKVAPLPEMGRSLMILFVNPGEVVSALEHLLSPPLSPISLLAISEELSTSLPDLREFISGQPPHMLVLARFAGVAGAVERQLREASRRSVELGARCIEVSVDDAGQLWQQLADFTMSVGSKPNVLLRTGARPARLLMLGRTLEQVTRRYGWASQRLAMAGIGLAYSRWWLPTDCASTQLAAAIAELRSEIDRIDGYAVVEDLPATMREQINIWGKSPDTLPLMRTLRSKWDPAGILNPGRYVV
jgi:glycolate oxidase FAD binding subunit